MTRVLRLLVCGTLVHYCLSLGFPHIYTKGSHYQVGFDIGRTFKAQIQDYYAKHPLLRSKFLPWIETPYGEYIIQGYIDITQLQYELILNEIQGIADGAELPFLEVFMMNYASELSALIGGKVLGKEADACSDILINYPDLEQVVIGHNEDNLPLVKSEGYFVTAHVIEKSENGSISFEEKFTHFTYPGVLPGNAFGFNNHGVAYTVNALYPEEVLTNKTGRYILTRTLIGASNLDEAKRILHNEGYGAAYGFNINMGILPRASINNAEIWEIEVAPNSAQNHSLLNMMKVSSSYYHVNKYRRTKIAENKKKIVSSIHRAARIEQYNVPKNMQDILTILGDTTDVDYPIYRTPRPTDEESTAATALFDLTKHTLFVYKDNPANSSYGPVMTLDIDVDF